MGAQGNPGLTVDNAPFFKYISQVSHSQHSLKLELSSEKCPTCKVSSALAHLHYYRQALPLRHLNMASTLHILHIQPKSAGFTSDARDADATYVFRIMSAHGHETSVGIAGILRLHYSRMVPAQNIPLERKDEAARSADDEAWSTIAACCSLLQRRDCFEETTLAHFVANCFTGGADFFCRLHILGCPYSGLGSICAPKLQLRAGWPNL